MKKLAIITAIAMTMASTNAAVAMTIQGGQDVIDPPSVNVTLTGRDVGGGACLITSGGDCPTGYIEMAKPVSVTFDGAGGCTVVIQCVKLEINAL